MKKKDEYFDGDFVLERKPEGSSCEKNVSAL